jgi:ABC-type nickel/cobalt efflux system permease component RcnA
MLAPDRIYPLLGLASRVIALGLGSALLWSRIGAARSERRRHGHTHPHPHSHDGGGASPVSRRGLASLALSGGLLPSPSARVTLLAAASVGRTTLGVLLIAAFSIGLAASLIGVGIVSLRAKDVAERRLTSRVAWLLPIASSAAIVATGVFLTIRGATQL